MVEEQIFRRGITSRHILDSFLKVERHLFVKKELRKKAYGDFKLDIGEDQQMSRPYIVAIMTMAVSPKKDSKVLEVGTGSGYHCAVLANLVKKVYSVELLEPLSKNAQRRLKSMGYKNITFKVGDGYLGWKEHAPFDIIIVTCHEDHVPKPLLDQLAVGGKMIIPISYSSNLQELVLLEKLHHNGNLRKTKLIPVELVPMIRGRGKK